LDIDVHDAPAESAIENDSMMEIAALLTRSANKSVSVQVQGGVHGQVCVDVNVTFD
jgi:hypothetical protein